jgi:general secretion pathway protein A
MYDQFFGFREKPFSQLPDPAFLYFTERHSTAYTLLEYSVLNQAGFAVVTGEVGCGKTVLVRHLLNELAGEATFGLLNNTHRQLTDLLQWVLQAFGLPYESRGSIQTYQAFVDFLFSEHSSKRRAVLVVDEAQNLDASMLEELRVISNVNADKRQMLQLILVGQPELKATLSQPNLRQLTQRVVAHYHLTPLSEGETIGYIRHRLQTAGGSPDLFTPEACHRIHQHSGGVPRVINLVCDTALVYGYADEVELIDGALVQNVIQEQAVGMSLRAPAEEPANLQPLFPTVSTPQPDGAKQGVLGRGERVTRFDQSDARQLFSHLVD